MAENRGRKQCTGISCTGKSPLSHSRKLGYQAHQYLKILLFPDGDNFDEKDVVKDKDVSGIPLVKFCNDGFKI